MVWTGKIARINLTRGKIDIIETPKNVMKHLVGGKGLGVYYLKQEMDPLLNPLDPESVFIVATGPAQGIIPIAGRYCVVAKSPHTGIFMDSHVGGYLGPELKFAGYDALIIKGKAEQPVLLKISDHEIETVAAANLWGKTILHAEDQIKELHDKKARILSIGPAGENLVNYACTVSDSYRNAARGGMGMLMGSKNLKAISIRGTNRLSVENEDQIKEIVSEINQRAKTSRSNDHPISKYGTSWLVSLADKNDQLPTLNYQYGEWELSDKIQGKAIEEHFKDKVKRKPCYKCSLSCSFVIETEFPWAEGKVVQHPEYESLALLGSNLGISDLEILLQLNHLCNIYGLDTISTGSTISWFMESAQRNAVPAKYQSEIINFGDSAAVLDIIPKIAFKEGVGKILAEGVVKAAKIFGNASDSWAVHVRGLELPAWDPRGKLGLGLSYITSNVGGSHLRGWPMTTDIPNKSMIPVIDSLIESQDLKILKDSLIMCHFTHSITPALNIADTAKIFESLTGIKSTEKTMREKAQRIWILSRQFNVEIWKPTTPRQTDKLPHRLMRDPLPSGAAKGMTSFHSDEDLNQALDTFYTKRKCDLNGIPTEDELEESIRF